MTFGEFVREKRKEKLFSQRRLAELIGISPVYLSYIEKGIRKAPKQEVLDRLGDVLDLDESDRIKMRVLIDNQRYDYIGNVPVDVVTYVSDNKCARDTLKLAKECQITDDDWLFIYDHISDKYL